MARKAPRAYKACVLAHAYPSTLDPERPLSTAHIQSSALACERLTSIWARFHISLATLARLQCTTKAMLGLEARTHQYVKIYFLFHILPYSKWPMLHDAYIVFLYNSARWGLCGIGKRGRGGTARRENSCGPPPHRPVATRRSTSLDGIALLRRPIASPHCINPCCVAILRRDIASPYCVAL